jgi:hypothetical protein
LCVVEALIILYYHDLQFFNLGTDAHDHLLIDGQGVHLHRETVQAALRSAAKATAGDVDEFGSHSLHFGGAPALWAAFHDTGPVKRWGRWATDTFHTYLWEDRKGSEGIAAAMAASDVTPG